MPQRDGKRVVLSIMVTLSIFATSLGSAQAHEANGRAIHRLQRQVKHLRLQRELLRGRLHVAQVELRLMRKDRDAARQERDERPEYWATVIAATKAEHLEQERDSARQERDSAQAALGADVNAQIRAVPHAQFREAVLIPAAESWACHSIYASSGYWSYEFSNFC